MSKYLYAISLENVIEKEICIQYCREFSELLNKSNSNIKTVVYSRYSIEEMLKKLDCECDEITYVFDYYISDNGSKLYKRNNNTGKLEGDTEYDSYVNNEVDLGSRMNLIMSLDELSDKLENFKGVTSSKDLKNWMLNINLENINIDDFYSKFMEIQSELGTKNFVLDIITSEKLAIIRPTYVSKQTALRWLQNKYIGYYTVAFGADETDLGLLSLSNKAYISEDSTLIKNNIVEQCNKINPGLLGPIHTLNELASKV